MFNIHMRFSKVINDGGYDGHEIKILLHVIIINPLYFIAKIMLQENVCI